MPAEVRHLWQIDESLREVERACESEELGDEEGNAVITAWLESCEDLPVKVDGYAALIRDYEALAEGLGPEIKRLQELQRTRQAKADRLKDRLHQFFTAHEITSLETARFKLAVQKVGGVLPLIYSVPVEELPNEYRETVIPEPVIKARTKEIRAALEFGDEIPGVILGERGTRLVIK